MTARWGRTPRHTQQHTAAAKVQATYPGLIVWFGEATGHFYLMDTDGLREYATVDALLIGAWWRTHRPAPRGAERPERGRRRAGRGAHRTAAFA